jgi:hypothetical protein
MNPNPEFENHRRLLESREDLKNWQDDDNPVIVFLIWICSVMNRQIILFIALIISRYGAFIEEYF